MDWWDDLFSSDDGSGATVGELTAAEQAAYDQSVLASSQQELADATMGYYTLDPGQGGMIGPTISEQDLLANAAAAQERLGWEIVRDNTPSFADTLPTTFPTGTLGTDPWATIEKALAGATGTAGNIIRLADQSVAGAASLQQQAGSVVDRAMAVPTSGGKQVILQPPGGGTVGSYLSGLLGTKAGQSPQPAQLVTFAVLALAAYLGVRLLKPALAGQ